MPYRHIARDDRVSIAALLWAKKSQKEIAAILWKSESAISRELERNHDPTSPVGYSSVSASANTAKRRIKANKRFRKIEHDKDLENFILKKTQKYWSPEQIAGRWRRIHPEKRICHETIYQYVYAHPELSRYLRCQKGKYRRKRGTKIRQKQREETKKRRIDIRPEVVEKRERIGDWEGDTVVGKGRSGRLLTYTERKSGYLLADKLDETTAEIIKEITAKRFERIPRSKKRTMTYDNGSEFAEYELIEQETGLEVYFAHAYSSWERGTEENTNGLLRQFFPKKMRFDNIIQDNVDKAVILINHRPRKRLGYLTPHEVFIKNCALD